MARLEIEVDKRSLKQTTKRLEQAIENSLSDGAGKVMDKAIDRGKEHIRDEEAVWRAEVLGKTMHADFDYTELSKAEKYSIWNSAMHAGIVDEGAQFDTLPNFTRLIPWVLDNLQDWDPFEDDDADSLDIGDSGDGGLDSIASQIGTVTQSQDTDESPVHGDSIVHDREPYDDSVFGVYTNRKQGNRTPFSYEVSGEVDYTDTTTITAAHASATWKHAAWDSDQQEKFISELKQEYGDTEVQEILDNLYQWKKGTFSEEAVWFEKLVKDKYDVDAGVRFTDEFDVDGPNQTTLDAYHEMGVAGREFLRRHFADDNGKLTAYRGFRGTQSSQLASRMLSNPDQNKWTFDDSVIQNYTLSDQIAESFSEGIESEVTIDVDEHLLLAPDFVLWDSIDTSNRDAEINVVGGKRHFGRDRLTFSGVDADTILDKDVTRFSDDEHDALHTLVNKMHEKEGLVSDPDMSERLSVWASEYDSQIGDDDNIAAKVDAITVTVNPSSDDSSLTFAEVTNSDISDENPLEEDDIARTEFGHFRIINPDGVTVGWQGEEQYLLQPKSGDEWDVFSATQTNNIGSPTHIGTTKVEYARPSDEDPVFGTWTEYLETGGENVHIYHKSDAPDEIKTNYIEGDTIYDTEWMGDRVGGTFLIQRSDGSVVTATLYQQGEGWKMVTTEGGFSLDWYPPGHDNAAQSDAIILGIPNEEN